MKMSKKDPRASMSKSVKGKSPRGQSGRNPITSASPAETPGVGECCAPAAASVRSAPIPDAVTDDDNDRSISD